MKKTFTIFVLLYSIFVSAQQRLDQEDIFLHYNNNLLLTGERVFYKAYCFNQKSNSLSKISKIANIELINSENMAILKQKINLVDGVGYGDFYIDSELESGTYKIVAYTKWMLNQKTVFEDNLYIINPFQKKTLPSITNKEVLKKEKKVTPSKLITLNKETFKTRELVKLSLNDSLLSGALSISVKKTVKNAPPKKSILYRKNNFTNNSNNSTLLLPEVRGYLIEGNITSKNTNNSISSIPIALSIPDIKVNKTGVTDQFGNFYFYVKNLNSDKINIEILNKNRSEYLVNLKNEDNLKIKFDNFKALKLTPDIISEIKRRTIYLQAEYAYNSLKKDSIINQYPIYREKLFTHNTTKIKLDDYKRFKTLKATIIEILEDVFYTKNENQYKIHVRDMDYGTNKEIPTLVIINGQIVYDHTNVIDLEAKKIDSITVLKGKYLFGSIIYQGIIEIHTFDKDFKLNLPNVHEFKITKPEQKKYYYKENYTTNKKDRIPDFRTQLYWNPVLIKTNKHLSFFTSDVKGIFEIQIQGITQDKKNIHTVKTFIVE
ncbi:conserved exported hypothetical protein [Tenacibaculum sediminilitoris]|uniref:hypothetical protein n=1 Tax=Tenacibaculum sediminilitoris TaxID=1820334 RepID=UPI0038938AD7